MSKKSLWLGHLYYQHMVPARSIPPPPGDDVTSLSRFFQCPLPSCPRTVSKLEDDHCLKFHLASHHSLKVTSSYGTKLKRLINFFVRGLVG